MQKKRIVLAGGLFLSLVFTGCGGHSTSSSAPNSASSNEGSTSENNSSATSASVSSSPTSLSSSGTSSYTSSHGSSSSVSSLPDMTFTGLVKIYYHNDNSALYPSKRLWVWGDKVGGSEYSFDNQSNPDDYGIYKIFDLSTAAFASADMTAMRFLIKNAGSWGGQSPDIVTGFNNYYPYKTTEDGKEMLTIYCVDESTMVSTYAQKSDALGDRLGSVQFTDWKTISCVGTGDSTNREAAEVGLCVSYTLYALPHSYWLLDSEDQYSAKESYKIASGTPNSNAWSIALTSEALCTNIYALDAVFASDTSKTKSRNVSWLKLYDNDAFVTTYCYDGTDLGYSKVGGQNYFKLWAPTAGKVTVNLYQSGTPNSLKDATDKTNHDEKLYELKMNYKEQGVWVYTDPIPYYDGLFYTYSVVTPEGTFETIDPYAKSSGVNGLRGAVLTQKSLDKTDPDGFADSLAAMEKNDPITSPNDLSVYEVHVRDFTADKSWVSKAGNRGGTYNAFVESGTTYESGGVSVKTGFDSLKELGPKAIQLLPVFDQDNDERTTSTTENGVTTTTAPDYNWGYNPLNYNVVEGSYSSDPTSATTKISEFKNLVKQCADNDIRVIMDVVYNHMASTSDNAFNKIMPKYYFLTNEEGYYYDETGCNNTVATGRKMAQSFIVQSVKFWAEEYGIKGFRFDLMGAIESSTMRAIKNALYDVDPEIVVYGEGWRVGGDSSTQATTSVVYSSLGDNGKGSVGCFNAGGRDGLKGETQDGHPAYGFMSQGQSDLSDNTMYNAACTYLGEDRYSTLNGLKTPPDQTLNYVSCHDNYTLYDSMKWCQNQGTDASGDLEVAMKASLACSSYVLLSQGISFFQGGEELFRSKLIHSGETYYDTITSDDACTLPDGVKMVRNSYKYGDAINAFQWDRKLTYQSYFTKFAEAFKTRSSLVKEGYLGVSYDAIQGTYTSGMSTLKYSRLWDDMVKTDSNGHRAILAAQTEFSKMPSASLKDFYSILGGRMNGTSDTLGIGAGTLEVVYDSTGTYQSGATLSDPLLASNAMSVGTYQHLILRRLA